MFFYYYLSYRYKIWRVTFFKSLPQRNVGGTSGFPEITETSPPVRCSTVMYLRPTANMDRVKRIWYLSPMRAAKVQASLRIRAVSPEPSLLAHTSSESRGTFRRKARSLAQLNGWACAVETCHDGMLEDTNSLDGAQMEPAGRED